MIKKLKEVPKELEIYTNSELPSEAFADDVNRLFPINDEDSVMESFAFLADNAKIPYIDYSKAEQLIILDRVCCAAEKYELNLEEYLESLKSLGGDTMTFDLNSPEAQAAVKQEVSRLMADFTARSENAKTLADAQKTAEEAKAALITANKEIETLKAEKQKAEQDFKEYQKDIEAKAKIRGRVDELKQVGLAKDEAGWSKIEEAIADMSDNAFAIYKESVVEAIKAKHYTPEEKKKLEEEEKKKKEAKASTDIVAQSKSEGKLPNGEPIVNEDKFPNMTKAFQRLRGDK
jgi:phage-related minor tail protein